MHALLYQATRRNAAKVPIGLLGLAVLLAICLATPQISYPLTPQELLVVANEAVEHSGELARYYMAKRGIPEANLIKLKAPSEENCSRQEYLELIAGPVRAFLEEHDPEGNRLRCLVIMYGLPLRIRAPELTAEEERRLVALHKEQALLKARIDEAKGKQDKEKLKILKDSKGAIDRQIDKTRKVFRVASLDSELALVREKDYPQEGWLPNKYFWGYRDKKIPGMPQNVTLVSRLDGPSEKTVRRIIDDSVAVEKQGLQGTAYFDARWPLSPKKESNGYGRYDLAIHNAARLLEKTKKVSVVLDTQSGLFQPGQCPDAALYCGWYSLAQYVDAFSWKQGAVGFHIASAECKTLKKPTSQVWCKVMLEKGVAATLGPVDEPYVESFPLPDIFFSALVDGHLPLVECFALANPFWSWKMVLIGDPLYRPFENRGS